MTDHFPRQVLERIKKAKEEAGVTHVEFAKRIGHVPGSVYRSLNNQSPSMRTLTEFIEALGGDALWSVKVVMDDGETWTVSGVFDLDEKAEYKKAGER